MATATAKPRINKYDNIRGFAIILVVIGHLLILSNPEALILRKIIYMLHLPLLFFVSGFFSKINENLIIKSFKQLIIPYIIFTILIRVYFEFILGKAPHNPIFLHPEFGLWFLISLFTMKILLPIFDKLKYPIITAVVIGLLLGFFDISHGTLGITRTFGYLPIFLAGFYYKPYKAKLEKNHEKLMNFIKTDKFLICFIILTLVAYGLIVLNLPQNTVELKSNYSTYNLSVLYEIFERLSIMLTQIALVLIMNKVMTNGKSYLTKIGTNTMQIYVLHLFLFTPAIRVIDNFPSHLTQITLSVICGMIITFALSGDWLSKYYNKFIDLIYDLFFYPISKK